MLDGIELKARRNIVALGITTEGVKIPLGCSTENATVATALLSDLVERGLDPEQGILFVYRRLQSITQSDPGRLRLGRAGPALYPPQRTQRARVAPGARSASAQASSPPSPDQPW